jgi:hypothetical protein
MMESPSIPFFTIKEVPITGGIAGASSQWDDSTWQPENAFSPSGSIYGWHSGKSGDPAPFPLYLWYDFQRSIRPADISFRPRQDGGQYGTIDHTVTKYQFVGTNDETCNEFSTWTILSEDLSGKPFADKFETRFCPVKNPVVNDGFRCLGLRILGTSDAGSGPIPGHACLNNIRMWERVYL